MGADHGLCTGTPTTAEIWKQEARHFSYSRMHGHQVRLLPLQSPHTQLEPRSVNLYIVM